MLLASLPYLLVLAVPLLRTIFPYFFHNNNDDPFGCVRMFASKPAAAQACPLCPLVLLYLSVNCCAAQRKDEGGERTSEQADGWSCFTPSLFSYFLPPFPPATVRCCLLPSPHSNLASTGWCGKEKDDDVVADTTTEDRFVLPRHSLYYLLRLVSSTAFGSAKNLQSFLRPISSGWLGIMG